MELFSADTTISKKMPMKHKKLALKVVYFSVIWADFSTANRPKTSPNLKLCSIKMAHRATYVYIMTLLAIRGM